MKDGQTYKKKVTEVKRKIRNSKNSYKKAVMQCRNTNPKMFYSYINRAKATRNKVGPLMSENGDVVVEPKEQACLLNEYSPKMGVKFRRCDKGLTEQAWRRWK